MAVLPVQIIAPTFPDGYCPADSQQFANDLLSGAQLSSSVTLDTVVRSVSAPSDHTKLWFKLDGAGVPYQYPPLPLYSWEPSLGVWVARHPFAPGKHLWEIVASEAAIWSLDGGSGADPSTTPPTATTGAFWKIEPLLAGRSPMSPGAIAQSNPAKTLGYAEAFGEGAHLQMEPEVGPHDHSLAAGASITDSGTIKVVTSGGGSAQGLLIGGSGNADTPVAVQPNEYDSAGQQAFNIVHPVYGMASIVRTARIWYLG